MVRRLPIRLIELSFRLRQSYPVWFYILNRQPRKLLRQNPPCLNDVQMQIIRELNDTGIAVTHLDKLFPEKILLPLLVSHAEQLRDTAAVKTAKTFLHYLWDIHPILDLKNPFLRICLSDTVLDTVNSYLRMYSRLYFLTLNVTHVSEKNTPPSISQNWHRDPEDKRIVKLFIYLNDVDEDSGPFIYIPYSACGLKSADIFPQVPPRGLYPPHGAVERLYPKEAIRMFTGRAGTMIFCDTTGLHKGGYATQKERVMFTGGYRSSVSAWRTEFKHPPKLEEKMRQEGFGGKARFAVEFNTNPTWTALLYWLKRN